MLIALLLLSTGVVAPLPATQRMSWRERCSATAALWPYMVPLTAVYFAEYAMQARTPTPCACFARHSAAGAVRCMHACAGMHAGASMHARCIRQAAALAGPSAPARGARLGTHNCKAEDAHAWHAWARRAGRGRRSASRCRTRPRGSASTAPPTGATRPASSSRAPPGSSTRCGDVACLICSIHQCPFAHFAPAHTAKDGSC